MKAAGNVVILFIVLSAVAGCGGPSPKPMPVEGVFGGISRPDVFDATVKVLHFSGYTFQSVSRESGIISTDWFVARMKQGGKGMYKLNIYIYEDESAQTHLSLKLRARWAPADKNITTEETASALINNMATRHVNRLFDEIGKIVGVPKLMGKYTIKLE